MPQYLVSTYFPDNFDPATIDEAAGVGVQLMQAENANALLGESGMQCVPALILLVDELVGETS